MGPSFRAPASVPPSRPPPNVLRRAPRPRESAPGGPPRLGRDRPTARRVPEPAGPAALRPRAAHLVHRRSGGSPLRPLLTGSAPGSPRPAPCRARRALHRNVRDGGCNVVAAPTPAFGRVEAGDLRCDGRADRGSEPLVRAPSEPTFHVADARRAARGAGRHACDGCESLIPRRTEDRGSLVALQRPSSQPDASPRPWRPPGQAPRFEP